MVVVIVHFTSIFLVLMGITVLCYPHVLTLLYGPDHSSPDWRNELKAVYGGFGIATGTLLFSVSYFDLQVKEGVQLCMGIALLGMAFGRIIALLFEKTGKWPLFFLMIEVALGSILVENASRFSEQIFNQIAGL